jgi:hypothetical protein
MSGEAVRTSKSVALRAKLRIISANVELKIDARFIAVPLRYQAKNIRSWGNSANILGLALDPLTAPDCPWKTLAYPTELLVVGCYPSLLSCKKVPKRSINLSIARDDPELWPGIYLMNFPPVPVRHRFYLPFKGWRVLPKSMGTLFSSTRSLKD